MSEHIDEIKRIAAELTREKQKAEEAESVKNAERVELVNAGNAVHDWHGTDLEEWARLIAEFGFVLERQGKLFILNTPPVVEEWKLRTYWIAVEFVLLAMKNPKEVAQKMTDRNNWTVVEGLPRGQAFSPADMVRDWLRNGLMEHVIRQQNLPESNSPTGTTGTGTETVSEQSSIDPAAQQILEKVSKAGIQFTQGLRAFRESEARRERAETAWRKLASFQGNAIPLDLPDHALWRRQGELVCELGKILRDDNWEAAVDAITPGPPAKQFAVAILRYAMSGGDIDTVAKLLKEAAYGDEAVDPAFQLGAFALPADKWLREGLMYEVLGIDPPLAVPVEPSPATFVDRKTDDDVETTGQPAGNDVGGTPPGNGGKKTKKGTKNREVTEKLISELTAWHQYADGGCLNYEPIGNNELARRAEVSTGSASNFFKSQFGEENSHAKYRTLCRRKTELLTFLKNLNREFTPYRLYGSAPFEKGEKDHDDDSDGQ